MYFIRKTIKCQLSYKHKLGSQTQQSRRSGYWACEVFVGLAERAGWSLLDADFGEVAGDEHGAVDVVVPVDVRRDQDDDADDEDEKAGGRQRRDAVFEKAQVKPKDDDADANEKDSEFHDVLPARGRRRAYHNSELTISQPYVRVLFTSLLAWRIIES